jgi:hypothetical protein
MTSFVDIPDFTLINKFLLLKNFSENLELNEETVELFFQLFGSNIKYKIIKKNNSILKNTKIQQKKDSISNKVNLILNKLSENNINNLIIEFIDNIGAINLNDYEEVQKTFYKKIIHEIKFINIYLKFFKIIAYLYNKIYKYTLNFFINIIELKFKKDYLIINQINDNKFDFLDILNDDIIRINNLLIIKNLIDIQIINPDILLYCDKIILNQKLFFSDIYFWFNDRKLIPNYIDIIKFILSNENINTRDKVLLDNLIKNKNIIK